MSRDHGLLSVPGLRAAAVHAGIKPSGNLDVGLVVADAPRPLAAVFTRNLAAAPPVHACRDVLASTRVIAAVVLNSGNANAMTGAPGRLDADAMIARAAGHTSGAALVLSTGIIGVPLPIQAVLGGIDACAAELSDGPHADARFADAMRTTDTFAKRARATVTLPSRGREIVVGGSAKGSGMIHPDMATMLAVIATDAPVAPADLDALLRDAVDRSFHEITVDGDTSTNDAVLLWAGAGDDPIGPDDPDWSALQGAVRDVAADLARQIVEDGEGMTRILEIRVRGAATDADARVIARKVGTSSLVKTALAGIHFDADRLALYIGDVPVLRGGTPVGADAATLDRLFGADEVQVTFTVGDGPGAARALTTDLTKGYVEINAEYTT